MTDTSTLFELLSNRTRRRLLVCLCDRAWVRVPNELSTRGSADAASSGGDPDGGTPGTPPVRFGEIEPAIRLLSANPAQLPSDLA